MYKYEGLLIHESHDDEGIIEVIDTKGIRSLHFGSYPRQSSMRLSDPQQLELEYVKSMTAWMLFKPALTDDALIVGLGGGSLTKHLLENFPDCRLKAVEYRKSVVKVARSYFGLPLDARLKVIIDDGGQYIRQRASLYPDYYSLLFIDAFDHEGMASSICNAAFFDACKALLKKDGMLVINLWGGTHNPEFLQVAQWIGAAFNWQTLFLPVKDRGNIIALAFNNYAPRHNLQGLRDYALALEQQYQIDFPYFLKELKKHNSSTFKLVIKP